VSAGEGSDQRSVVSLPGSLGEALRAGSSATYGRLCFPLFS